MARTPSIAQHATRWDDAGLDLLRTPLPCHVFQNPEQQWREGGGGHRSQGQQGELVAQALVLQLVTGRIRVRPEAARKRACLRIAMREWPNEWQTVDSVVFWPARRSLLGPDPPPLKWSDLNYVF